MGKLINKIREYLSGTSTAPSLIDIEPPYVPRENHLRIISRDGHDGMWAVRNIHTNWTQVLEISIFENGKWKKIYDNPTITTINNGDGTLTITAAGTCTTAGPVKLME